MFLNKEINKYMNSTTVNVLAQTVYKNFLDLCVYPELKHDINEIIRIIKSDHFVGYQIYDNNKVVGYILSEIITTQDGRLTLYIYYLYVSSLHRHHGLGKKLLDAAINKCDYTGNQFVMLTCNGTNYQLVNYYKKFGFGFDPIQTSIKPYIVMVKYL